MMIQRLLPTLLMLVIVSLLTVLPSSEAYAQAGGNGNQPTVDCNQYPADSPTRLGCENSQGAQTYLNNCRANFQNHQLVTMLVDCVEGVFRAGLASYVSIFQSFLLPTIIAVIAFSITLFGIRVTAGLQELNKEAMLYLVKLGLVALFIFDFDVFVNVPFIIVREATTIVVGGYAPWAAMDQVFCQFFGTGCDPTFVPSSNGGSCGQEHNLQNGLTGIIQAAAFSGIQGFLILILSSISTLLIIYYIFRAIHTYLASIALIAFVMILAPLLIPLALFSNTTRYLYKWIDYLIAAMLHPVLLFAFLFLFGGVIIDMLNWFTCDLLGGTDFSQHWRNNQNLFSWLLNSDPRSIQQLEGVLETSNGRTAVHSFVSPSMLNAVDVNPISSFAIDFGANQVWAMQLLVFGFLGLFITAYLLLSMINYLPRISESIAGVVLGLEVQGIPFVSELRHAFSKLKGSLGSSGGGGAG